MIAIDLFAGAGGFTSAANMAGVEVAFAANHSRHAVDVHTANHPGVIHECQDLRQFNFNKLDPFDILLASPSCQGHSKAGRQGRKNSKVAERHDMLRSTAWAVIDCLEACRPRLAIVENVVEFKDWECMPAWELALELMGYSVTSQVLTASMWGVGQRRRRIFYVAHLGDPISVSDPEGVDETGVLDVFDPDASGWRSIATMSQAKPGAKYKSAGDKARISNERRRGELGHGQHTNYGAWGLDPSRPCPTITTCPAHLFWTRGGEYRLWTDLELLRAMSFPDTYDLCGSTRAEAARLIGNAVPPKLGAGLIKSVIGQAGC